MDRDAFLDQIAARLGRARQQRPPFRTVVGVPDFEDKATAATSTTALLQTFSQELGSVGGEVRVVPRVADVKAVLQSELARFQAQRVVTAARSELAHFGLDWLWQEQGARAVLDAGMTTEADQRAALIHAEVGITAVHCAIANTGSLVLSAATTRPRSLSLLPTVHIALLFARQIEPNLGAAFGSLKRAGSLPSAAHVITGPSRTSDIENDLTIGVHGPSAVTAIVVEEDPS